MENPCSFPQFWYAPKTPPEVKYLFKKISEYFLFADTMLKVLFI